jgi:L-fuconolactonase
MKIVGAHVHFWDPGALTYPWLDEIPALRRSFLPRDYPGDAAAMVFVEANCAPDECAAEVDLVGRLAATDARITGIVAFVDVTKRTYEKLERLSRNPRVVGVRHNIQGTPPGFCIDKRFVRGVGQVASRGFTFDLCATAGQLRDVAALVERNPDTQFVLDHCGKPAIRDDAFDAWARDIEQLARFENVMCKLSGLLSEARADQRNVAALLPYVDHVSACFGAARLMYGSDWPVLTIAGGLDLWRSLVQQLTSHWPAADQRRLFADNAVALYRLPHHAHA